MAQTNTKSIKSSATQSSSMSDKERERKTRKKQEQMRNREVLLQKPTWLRILMRISKGAYIHGLHYCNSKES